MLKETKEKRNQGTLIQIVYFSATTKLIRWFPKHSTYPLTIGKNILWVRQRAIDSLERLSKTVVPIHMQNLWRALD